MFKYTEEQAFEIYRQHGLEPLTPYINCKEKIKCLNSDGYFVDISLQNVLANKSGKVFSAGNRFVLDNIKKFIHDDTNGEYKYVSGEFKNAYSVFTIKHNKCGRTFEAKWCNIHRKASAKEPNRHGSRCPFCEAYQIESTHASVLKQIWLHEREGTVVEDKSCVNPNTNCPLPTDIVNHNDKIAIEVQSWYHDFDDQKKKDEIKKNFWLNMGYQFYAIDQREYTVLEMVQIFFPYITEIPSYIDLDYSNRLDVVKLQEELNSGLSVPEIADLEGCSRGAIYGYVANGAIHYPDNYIPSCHSPVVQLDLDNNFIREYKTINSAIVATGIRNISDILCHGRHCSGGYKWYYSKDYYALN